MEKEHSVDQVIEDLKARKQLGIERYGEALHAGMERDTLLDAYEEALDLCVYLRCELEKRDTLKSNHPTLTD